MSNLCLALDQSTTKTGWAVVDLDSGRIEECGVFKAPGKWWVNRIELLDHWLDSKLTLARYTVLAYEIPTHDRSQAVTRKLGAAMYVVIKVASHCVPTWWGFTASQVRKSGYGKKDIKTMTASARKLGRTPTEDEADAIAVAMLAYRVTLGEGTPTEVS